MSPQTKKKITAEVDPKYVQLIGIEAAKLGMKKKDIIEMALKQYFADKETEAKETNPQ